MCWDLHFTNFTNFQSLEVVDRGSETQLQLTENLKLVAGYEAGYGGGEKIMLHACQAGAYRLDPCAVIQMQISKN